MSETNFTIVPAHPGWMALSHMADGSADDIGDPIIAWLVVMLPARKEDRSDEPPSAYSVPITAEGTQHDCAALKRPDGRVMIPDSMTFPTFEGYAEHLEKERIAAAA